MHRSTPLLFHDNPSILLTANFFLGIEKKKKRIYRKIKYHIALFSSYYVYIVKKIEKSNIGLKVGLPDFERRHKKGLF